MEVLQSVILRSTLLPCSSRSGACLVLNGLVIDGDLLRVIVIESGGDNLT